MSSPVSRTSFNAEGEVSLYDVWQKLVQYQKTFWAIFLVIFALGVFWVLLTPQKYNFSQIIEIGRLVGDDGRGTRVIDLNDAVVKIKKILLPQALRAYDLPTSAVVSKENLELKVDKTDNDNGVASGVLTLSIDGPLTSADKYKFVFQHMIGKLANETDYINLRIKSLSALKTSLENNLIATNVGDIRNQTMASRWNTIANIHQLQMQIDSTYNTRAISDFTVSAVGSSKLVYLFGVAIVAFFFAFFGVFVADFIGNLSKDLVFRVGK